MSDTDWIPAGAYRVDAAHSTIGFEVKHMALTTVRGLFRDFEGTITVAGDLSAQGKVMVASLDTGTESRDNDLRSSNFFDADRFPEIAFQTSRAGVTPAGEITLAGEMTIKETTRPIELSGEVGRAALDPFGNYRIGFDVQGVIDRREFGLTWSQTLANGSLVVANKVKLVIDISAIRTA